MIQNWIIDRVFVTQTVIGWENDLSGIFCLIIRNENCIKQLTLKQVCAYSITFTQYKKVRLIVLVLGLCVHARIPKCDFAGFARRGGGGEGKSQTPGDRSAENCLTFLK